MDENLGVDGASDDSSDPELFPIDHDRPDIAFNYRDPNLICGIMKDVVMNDREEVLRKISLGKSVRVIDNNGNSLLHVAVESFQNDMSIINSLISQDEIDVNAVNFENETPLMTSIKLGKSSVTFHMIKVGADVNYPAYKTPLHLCCNNNLSSEVGEALIKAGAYVNVQDLDGDTPLHIAVLNNDLEMLSMLLCYGAKLIKNYADLTPFTLSLTLRKFDLADALLDYVTDFDSPTLCKAINCRYPHLLELIKRIVMMEKKFHFSPSEHTWILLLNDSQIFELVWRNFHIEYEFDLILQQIFENLFSNKHSGMAILDVIMKSDERTLVKLTRISDKDPFVFLMSIQIIRNLQCLQIADMEYFQKFIFFLLSYGLNVWDIDLDIIFELFGYNELFKLMLHMNIKSTNIPKFNILPYFIYSVDNSLSFNDRVMKHILFRNNNFQFQQIDFEELHRHLASPFVETKVIERLRKNDVNITLEVPKLLELARNYARDFITTKYKIKNSQQFYTKLKYLPLPLVMKELISFECTIYENNPPVNFEARKARWQRILEIIETMFER